MRLTRIEIENFKGIGTRQAIYLKPITLLFGPNSAGKSTILQALHYVREILERNNPDPDQTIAGGLIDLGGFATLVHNHDLSRAISIKLVIDLLEEQGSDRLPINSGISLNDSEFEQLPIRYLVGENTDLEDNAIVQEVGVELEIRWSDLLGGPYVSVVDIEMDGEPIASINSPPQEGRAHLTDFNFTHPLFRQYVDPDDIMSEEEAKELVPDEASDDTDDDPFNSPLGAEIWELSRELASPEAKEQFLESTDEEETELTEFRIAVKTEFGALPTLDDPLWLDLVDVDEKSLSDRYAKGASSPRLSKQDTGKVEIELRQENARRNGLQKLLDELVLGPMRIVRDHLNAMTYIGPLREIPTRSFRPRMSPDESRWAQGLAAWDLLHSDVKGDLLDNVNLWLSGEGRLGTGYHIEKAEFREIAVPGRMSLLFERGLTEDDLGELQELYSNLESRTEVALRDLGKGILVAPGDVGVGISQMIPVLVGCLRSSDGILAVEQPELHIHPAVQIGLGDLFIHAIQPELSGLGRAKSLLIETHSEHIMLRLLRRIREASENELPPGALALTPDDLSVIYVEANEDGVNFHPLRVDNEGEFIDRWPRGFFEERAEELF